MSKDNYKTTLPARQVEIIFTVSNRCPNAQTDQDTYDIINCFYKGRKVSLSKSGYDDLHELLTLKNPLNI